MYEEVKEEIPGLSYHRLTMSDDAAPSEEVRLPINAFFALAGHKNLAAHHRLISNF